MIDASRAPTPHLDTPDGARAAASAHAIAGRLAGVDDDGRLRFDDGTRVYPVDIGVEADDETLVRAARAGRAALVAETTRGPVLVALVRARVAREATLDAGAGETSSVPETLTLSATRRVEITCGKARIVLEPDGRVHVQGTHLLSSATGPIRIKGATVALN